MKKLISWMSVLAMASSSLVAIPISANAAVQDVLFSNSFNGYTNSVVFGNYAGTVGDVMVYGSSANAQINIDDMNLITNTRSGGDDTSYWKATTEGDNTYLTTSVSRFSTVNRGAELRFDETYTPDADNAVVVSFKYKMTAPVTPKYAPIFKIGNTVINANSFAAEDAESVYDTWYDVKLVVYPEMTEIYNGSEYVGESADTSVSSMRFSAYDESGADLASGNEVKEAGYGDYMTVSIDDLVIFTSDSENPTLDEVPAAKDPEGAVVTPTPAPTNAPKAEVTIPSDVSVIATANFDGQDISSGKRVRVYPAQTAMSFVDGGFTVSAGTTNATRSETYGEVKAYTYGENGALSSQVLEMYDSGYASAARGPVLQMTNPVSATNLPTTDDAYHLVFQVKLDRNGTDDAKLYLVDTKGDDFDNPGTYSYLGSDNQYKYVLATLQTGEAQDTDGDNRIVRVPEGEFVVVDFYLYSDGFYCIDINGEYAFEHSGTVSYGTSSDYKITPSQLPAMVVNVDKGGATLTKATIDDVYVYSTVKGDVPTDTYTKYVATYDESGVLTGLDITENATPEATANTETQKTFYWKTNTMVPFAN